MILTIKLTGTVIFNTFYFQRMVTVVIYFLFYKVDYCKLSVLLVVILWKPVGLHIYPYV